MTERRGWWRRPGPARPAPVTRWPVELPGSTPRGEPVRLRPLALGDETAFSHLRRINRAWLQRWEATAPQGSPTVASFAELVAHYDREARDGRALPFVIEVGGQLAGQLNLSNIVLGSFRSCTAGYWVARTFAGRLVTPTALALAGDFAMGTLGLHRLEVNIRPENAASLAVVRKLGFRDEGMRLRLLHIDGAWRDHRSFAVTTEDLAGGTLMDRVRTSHNSHFGDTPEEVPGG